MVCVFLGFFCLFVVVVLDWIVFFCFVLLERKGFQVNSSSPNAEGNCDESDHTYIFNCSFPQISRDEFFHAGMSPRGSSDLI